MRPALHQQHFETILKWQKTFYFLSWSNCDEPEFIKVRSRLQEVSSGAPKKGSEVKIFFYLGTLHNMVIFDWMSLNNLPNPKHFDIFASNK